MMYRLVWRYGAKFAISNGKLSLFFRAGYWSAIRHGRLLHLGWGVDMCQLATGAGAVVCSRLQRYLKKIGWDTGKDGFGRAFCDDSPFAYILLRSIRDLQALLIFRAGLLPKFFFFLLFLSTHLFIIPYLMPNGHLSPIGGRAAITIFLRQRTRSMYCHIWNRCVLSLFTSNGNIGVCALTWAFGWGGGAASNHEIRYLLLRASVGAYLKAGLVWHMYGHAASNAVSILRREVLALAALHRFFFFFYLFLFFHNFTLRLLNERKRFILAKLCIRPSWLIIH